LWSYAVNRLYQFWIHTEYIDRTPRWFEWLFNTPSHHRVHHGVDEAYLDKNYGAVLIVWDRLFGTFEREAQRPTYGTTNQLGSYNPVWANLEHWVRCARIMKETPRWRDKLWVWFAHPAWRPGEGRVPTSPEKMRARCETPKYRPEATPRVGWYVLVQFLVFAPSVTVLVRLRTTMTWWELGVGAAMVAFGQLVLIALLESKRWARAGEIVRLMMLVTATGWVTWSYAPERLRLAIVAAMGVFIIVSMAAFAWSLRATQESALGVDGSRAAST
ncbi:MAG: sterol desaturase family protein, partial [Nannocystaceae bacterium]